MLDTWGLMSVFSPKFILKIPAYLPEVKPALGGYTRRNSEVNIQITGISKIRVVISHNNPDLGAIMGSTAERFERPGVPSMTLSRILGAI